MYNHFITLRKCDKLGGLKRENYDEESSKKHISRFSECAPFNPG